MTLLAVDSVEGMVVIEPTWQRGGVRLWLGDCRELLPQFEPGSVGAVVTDPPYGIGLRNGDVDGHRSDRDFTIIGDTDQTVGLAILTWAEINNYPTIFFASPWKPWPGEWRNLVVWDKGGAVGGGGDIATCLKRSWELIQVARNGPIQHGRGESVWRCTMTGLDTADHICAKPVRLMAMLLDVFTNTADTILDPFMGSGTCGVAAVKLGRKFIGIEISEQYFSIAVRRINEAIDSTALFETVPAAVQSQIEWGEV